MNIKSNYILDWKSKTFSSVLQSIAAARESKIKFYNWNILSRTLEWIEIRANQSKHKYDGKINTEKKEEKSISHLSIYILLLLYGIYFRVYCAYFNIFFSFFRHSIFASEISLIICKLFTIDFLCKILLFLYDAFILFFPFRFAYNFLYFVIRIAFEKSRDILKLNNRIYWFFSFLS